MTYRKNQGLEEDFLGLGLTSRKNLCLHPTVSRERKGKVVDSKCRNLTASWVRAKAGVKQKPQQQDDDGNNDAMDIDPQQQVELCNFYETLEAANSPNPIPNGVYTFDNLKSFCKTMSYCPYYLVRRAVG